MPLLDTKKQVAAKLEAITGTAETLAAADVDIIPITAQMSPDFDSFEQEFVRSTLTRLLGVTTQELGAFTLTSDIRGTQLGTYAAGAPSWFKYAKACGMEQDGIELLSVGSPTAGSVVDGPFRHGETITGGTSSATATVVHDWHNGCTGIYIRNRSGTFQTSETLTGESTGARAVANSSGPVTTDYGYCLFPVDNPQKQVDVSAAFTTTDSVEVGDVVEGATSGALGVYVSNDGSQMVFTPLEGAFSAGESLYNRSDDPGVALSVTVGSPTNEAWVRGDSITIRLLEDGYYSEIAGARGNMKIVFPQVNRPARVEFAFAGFWNAHGDTPLLTGTSPNSKTPPLFRNQALYVGDNLSTEDQADEYGSCVSALELDIGNQLVNRECQDATKGIKEVLVSERQGAGRIDPELTLAAVHDWITFFQNGTPMRLRTTLGTANGNKFYITAPGLQYESAAPGARNKVVTRDLGFKLTGGNLNNLTTAQTTLETIGGANELVISYITIP